MSTLGVFLLWVNFPPKSRYILHLLHKIPGFRSKTYLLLLVLGGHLGHGYLTNYNYSRIRVQGGGGPGVDAGGHRIRKYAKTLKRAFHKSWDFGWDFGVGLRSSRESLSPGGASLTRDFGFGLRNPRKTGKNSGISGGQKPGFRLQIRNPGLMRFSGNIF